MKASVMDLRYRSKEILRALGENKEVILTHRGKVKGRIVPAGKQSGVSLAGHEAVGMWADQSEAVEEMVSRLRKPRSC